MTEAAPLVSVITSVWIGAGPVELVRARPWEGGGPSLFLLGQPHAHYQVYEFSTKMRPFFTQTADRTLE